jgi:hypothetical protein
MLKLILSAGIASLVLCSAGYAATPSASPQSGSSDLVQIKQGNNNHRGNHRGWGDDNWRDRSARNFDSDRRYRNWHRYAYRPDDWGGRGCVSVGPMWYCP